MKGQTGVWIDAQVWDVYRELCDREKLRLSEPIEARVLTHSIAVECHAIFDLPMK
jgi:hypothetical protein